MRYGPAFSVLVLALGIIADEGLAQNAGDKSGQTGPAAQFQQYRVAAAQGDPAALDGLGGMFERGSSVPADFAKAYALFHLAASRQGANPALIAQAVQHRDTLGARMSSAQLARVHELIALCNGSDVNRCAEIIIAAGAASAATASAGATGEGFRTSPDGKIIVRLQESNGAYYVPALVNGLVNLRFLIDTGATDVGIPADVVQNMVLSGRIEQADFLEERTYQIANGTTMRARTFRIRSMKVGNVVIENVRGHVLPEKATLLLGQSFLGRLKSWSLDNATHTLIIE